MQGTRALTATEHGKGKSLPPVTPAQLLYPLSPQLLCPVSTQPSQLPCCAVQAPLLGTLSVWWAMSALGFFVAVLPFVTITGFRHGLLRPFCAALALILLFLPFKVRIGHHILPIRLHSCHDCRASWD